MRLWLKTYFFSSAEVEIRENFLIRQNFTNLLKSVPWPWFAPRGKLLTFYPPRLLENVFPLFKREANSSWKNNKMKLTFRKNFIKSCSIHRLFFFLRVQSVHSFWVWIEKKTTFTISKIQTMKKLDNLTTYLQGSFLS